MISNRDLEWFFGEVERSHNFDKPGVNVAFFYFVNYHVLPKDFEMSINTAAVLYLFFSVSSLSSGCVILTSSLEALVV